MRFIRAEDYTLDRSLRGQPLISPLTRWRAAQLSLGAGLVWLLTLAPRAVGFGVVAAERTAMLAWMGTMLAAGAFVVPLTCLIHELWHHAAAPGGIRSDRNVMLLKWGWLPVAAAREAWVSRNRQLIIHLMPIAAMTALCLIAASFVSSAHRLYVALFWELNLLLSVGDLIVAWRIVRLEPEARLCGTLVRGSGTGSAA